MHKIQLKTYPGIVSVRLDYLRALSALLVVLAHGYQIFVIPTFPTASNMHTLFVNVGWMAVNVFFILSGFVTYGSLAKVCLKTGPNKSMLFQYGVSRLSRLYPPLIFSIMFSVFVYLVILFFFSREYLSAINFREYYFVIREGIDLGVTDVLCNLFFLQGAACAPLIINGPLWSLSYEFWFYVFAAGLFVLVYGCNIWGMAICLTPLLIFGIAGAEFQKFFLGFLVWGSGLWGGRCFHKGESLKIVITGYIVIVAVCLFSLPFFERFYENFIGYAFYAKVIFALVFSMLFFLIYLKEDVPVCLPFRNFFLRISSVSYTLYLLHFPLMVGIFVVYNKFYALTVLVSMLIVLVSTLLSLLMSYHVGVKVEAINLRKILNI